LGRRTGYFLGLWENKGIDLPQRGADRGCPFCFEELYRGGAANGV